MADDEAPDTTNHPETLAQKIDRLFKTVHRARGREYTYEEVAESIRAQGGPTISATYVWQLRKGQRDNPTKQHLEALSTFFNVPPAYFFDDATAADVAAQLDLLAAMRDAQVKSVALRAHGISPDGLDAIHAMIDHVRKLEKLPLDTRHSNDDEQAT